MPPTKTKPRPKPKTKIPASKSLPPTDGPVVCRWIEANLVHSEGDFWGKSFRLTDNEKLFIYRAYERNPDGSRKHRRALKGLPKGGGKTELAAAIACEQLGGPTAPPSPLIPVEAASFEQADLLFGSAASMLREGPLSPYFDIRDTEILRRDGPGRMLRVATAAGTNDGLRPTFLVADEVHELVGPKERVHLVLANGLSKRLNSWELMISTAGSNKQTLLGRLYDYGVRVRAGEIDDPTFLFDWLEAPADADLSSDEGLRAAIRACNPAADVFFPLENLVRRFREIPEYEFRRYHLNQWTESPERWLPMGAWEKLRSDRELAPGENVVLAFDGSYNNDSTGIVACALDRPHFEVVGVWEKPADRDDWVVPREEVDLAVSRAFEKFAVREMACDPPGWHSEIRHWAETYGETTVIEYPTNERKRMVPACSKFYAAVVQEAVSHNGDERLTKHLANAVVKETSDGAYITKDGRNSPRKIDLAVCAVIANDRASMKRPEPRLRILGAS